MWGPDHAAHLSKRVNTFFLSSILSEHEAVSYINLKSNGSERMVSIVSARQHRFRKWNNEMDFFYRPLSAAAGVSEVKVGMRIALKAAS
jgi:hypothetical protein